VLRFTGDFSVAIGFLEIPFTPLKGGHDDRLAIVHQDAVFEGMTEGDEGIFVVNTIVKRSLIGALLARIYECL
jgi:hypothetical protein